MAWWNQYVPRVVTLSVVWLLAITRIYVSNKPRMAASYPFGIKLYTVILLNDFLIQKHTITLGLYSSIENIKLPLPNSDWHQENKTMDYTIARITFKYDLTPTCCCWVTMFKSYFQRNEFEPHPHTTTYLIIIPTPSTHYGTPMYVCLAESNLSPAPS